LWRQPAKLRRRVCKHRSGCIAIRLPGQSGTDTDGKYDQETGEATRGSPAKRRPHRADRRALHRIETWPSEIWLERSDIWLVRRLSQKTADFGVIAIDLGRAPADAIKEMRHRKVLRELGWCRGNCGIHRFLHCLLAGFNSHDPVARGRPN
jgi:hypothetical protein